MLGPLDVFIVGPTASGKSQRAIEWACEMNFEIVNCDSLQFYKDLQKGTAYPTSSDFAAVKHHLFGVASLGTQMTAGEFVRRFKDLRNQFKDQKFLCVGGSGFYIKALETGLYDLTVSHKKPSKYNASLAKEMSLKQKYELLKDIDPKILDTIHPHDDYRLSRALEIFFTSGILPSTLKAQGEGSISNSSHPKLGLYLSREELKKRVSNRVKDMIQGGLIEEVQSLLQKMKEKNMSLSWKPLQSVGYKEVLLFLNGSLSKEELESFIVQSTLQLAKRQMTWFRSDKKVLWFHASKEIKKARLWLKDYLKSQTLC